jgi:hypothetical protein
MMSNLGSHSFGIKFESDDSASSMMSGNSVQGDPSQYDAAEAAVAKLGSLMDGQRGKFSCAGIRAIASGLMGALNCLLFPRLTNSPPPPSSPHLSLSPLGFLSHLGGLDGSSLKRTPDAPPSDGMGDMSNKKKKPLTHERREDRNLREKERSLKITQQIHELRGLLSMGGVIVPKVS